MDKNNWKVKRKEDKNVAVQRWLQEGHSFNTGIENPASESHDVMKNTADIEMVVSKDVFGRIGNPHIERLEIHGRPIYRENSKECQSHESDIETDKGSNDNVLPTLLITKCATGGKHVTFDNYVTSANENFHRERSTTGFLLRKDSKPTEQLERTKRYIVSPSRSDDVIQHENPTPKDDTDIFLEDFSNHVVVNDQPLSRHSAKSRQRTAVREDIPSVQSYHSTCHQVKGLGWRQGTKRQTSGAKTRNLPPNSSGSIETQVPVIRGLVIDIVENQKPSVVRASKNANIREEFALNQKVKSYRNARNNNINTINHAQRKLGANLICLQNRLKLVTAKGHRHHVNAPLDVDDRTLTGDAGQTEARMRSDPIELCVYSKGCVPATVPLSKTYSFPALIYPQRRSLTIKQCV